jgi:hypothetical protein
MNISKYTLTENDLNDFQVIFQKLSLPMEILTNLFGVKREIHIIENRDKVQDTSQIPSIKDFARFKKWLLEKIKDIEGIFD